MYTADWWPRTPDRAGKREIEGDRERKRDRERHRHKPRRTETEKDRHTHGDRDKHIDTELDTERENDRQSLSLCFLNLFTYDYTQHVPQRNPPLSFGLPLRWVCLLSSVLFVITSTYIPGT